MLPATAAPITVPCVAHFNIYIIIELLKAYAVQGKDVSKENFSHRR